MHRDGRHRSGGCWGAVALGLAVGLVAAGVQAQDAGPGAPDAGPREPQDAAPVDPEEADAGSADESGAGGVSQPFEASEEPGEAAARSDGPGPRPSTTASMMQRARQDADEGRFEEALRLLEQIVELEPRNAQAWGGLGVLRMRVGAGGAVCAMRRALRLDPGLEEVRRRLRIATEHLQTETRCENGHMVAGVVQRRPGASAGALEDDPTARTAGMRAGWWWQAWFAGVTGFVVGAAAGGALGCGAGSLFGGGGGGCIVGSIGGAVIGGGIGIADVVDSVGDDAGGNGTFWGAYLGQAIVGVVGGALVAGLLTGLMDDGVRDGEYLGLGLLLTIGLFGPPGGAVVGYELTNDN